MPAWAWILIVVAIVVVIALIAWSAGRSVRSERLRSRFGPEYDRTVEASTGKREAEAELDARRKRREQLDIRPLDPAARQRYAQTWTATQSRFVDTPPEAVREADVLVTQVMRDRGYPTENFEQRSIDVSVDHPVVVENYRAAHAISLANDQGLASTEDLRQAMVHYRALFQDLLGDDATGMREAR
jgi:hypothetical protein